MIQSEIQRKSMVDSQVRPSDVTDRRIPRAMLAVPREAFVPASRKAIAYMDGTIPLDAGGGRARSTRSLLAPRTLAKMMQALEIADDASVLDIGSGTGYSAALFAHFTKSVVALECDAALAATARSAMDALGLTSVEVVVGPLTEGVPGKGPFDAILIGGKVSDVPAGLLDQLKDGGRLVAIVDEDGVGRAKVWRRYAMRVDCRPVFDAEAGVLPGFERQATFAL